MQRRDQNFDPSTSTVDPVIRAGLTQTPILLSGTTPAMLPGSRAGIADTTRLQNPFDGPMLLDEIRVRVDTGNTNQVFAGRFHVDLRLGDMRLTSGAVPLMCLGRKLNPGAQVTVKTFAWRLPSPLWIPASGYLQPIFYFDNLGFTDMGAAVAHYATVTYVGRPLKKGTPAPAVRRVPWIASYKTPVQTAVGQASYESTESDLINPFNTALKVQRLTGVITTKGHDANTLDVNTVKAAPVLTHSETQIRMVDNLGRIVIRDATPFANVFKPADDSWTVNAVLPPHGFFRAMIDLNDTGATLDGNVQMQMAMIGTREV